MGVYNLIVSNIDLLWAGIFCRLQVAGCRLKNGLLSLSEST